MDNMLQLKDKQVCIHCGNPYIWVWTENEGHGEGFFGRCDELRKNVKNCTRINNTNRYSINVECPNCGKREFIERFKM